MDIHRQKDIQWKEGWMNGWMDRQLRSKTAKIHKMKVWMGEKQYTQQTSHWISLDR